MKKQDIPLLVTTTKGVFFGYGQPTDAKTIRIERARMCVFWSQNMKGVLGLASIGPDAQCRISPQVVALTLNDVTAVVEVSPDACAKWEKQPWS